MSKYSYKFHDGLGGLHDGLVVTVGLDPSLVILGVLVDSFLPKNSLTL